MNPSTSHRILVVDDQAAIHEDYRKILGTQAAASAAALDLAAVHLFGDDPESLVEWEGFEIDSAFQGQEGVELVELAVAQRRPYAMAFVDIRMPHGWDGVETVRRIWQVDPEVLVVLCSAYSDYSWQELVRELGRNDRYLILRKPFDIVEVRQLASALVMKWNLARMANRTLSDLQNMVQEQVLAIQGAQEETIYRLVRASLCRDEETGAHIRRTGLYSELLAATAGWDADRVNQIRLAAPMHDVGKIGIPDAILRKPGKLSSDEIRVLRDHTVLGAKMLAGSASPVLHLAQEIALCHHEYWDGSGYPAGLKGEQIPESARIVSIVDVFDSLMHNRVYRERFPESEALELMQAGRGTQFDPRLFDVFMSLLPEMRAITHCVPDEEADPIVQEHGSALSVR